MAWYNDNIRERMDKIYYKPISVLIRRDDGHFYDDLMDAAYFHGITPAEYMRQATKERLERERIK